MLEDFTAAYKFQISNIKFQNQGMTNKFKIINDPVHGFIQIPHEIIFDVIEHRYFPVSYTHLDVYKRQVFVLVKLIKNLSFKIRI